VDATGDAISFLQSGHEGTSEMCRALEIALALVFLVVGIYLERLRRQDRHAPGWRDFFANPLGMSAVFLAGALYGFYDAIFGSC
jgi:uncharacterized membrane protein YfcA